MNDAAVKEKSWKEFQESGMLWMANTILQDADGNIISVCPARVKYRGFTHETNIKGYIKTANYMKENAEEILKEAMQ